MVYPVQLEIAGPAAMFTRPDSGASFISYPAPTFSAAKGIFESIARLKSAYIRPTRAEVCSPIRYHRYVTNYGGALRNPQQMDGSFQLIAVILVNVCYRLFGVVEEATASPVPTNHVHALQQIFLRRVLNGQCFSVPVLGWKEFTASYWGPFREGTRVETSLDLEIPSMLHSVFSKPVSGVCEPRYERNVRIEKGVLTYAK